jgi:hypothetical protein
MRTHRDRRIEPVFRFLFAGGLLFASACGGGGAGDQDDKGGVVAPLAPAPPPPPTSTLSGSVNDEGDLTPVPGAVVTVDGISATTSSEGQFTLTKVPVGAVTVRIVKSGFDTLTRAIPTQAGSNYRVFSLTRVNTVYENDPFTTYLPSASTIRGVFVLVLGGTSDGRPLIRGDLDYYRDTPNAPVTEYRQPLMAFARAQGFAVMGMVTPSDPGGLHENIRGVLVDVSGRSGHPELAEAPLLLMGHSRGGCMVYEVAVRDPDHVIGVLPMASLGVAGCLQGSPPLSVPTYFIVGDLDTPSVPAASTAAFEQNRPRGAVWAHAIEPGLPHQWTEHREVIFNWASAVAARRLPASIAPGTPVQLRSVSEASGWLGDRTSFAIAGFACFTGDKGRASWLPTEQNARDWQAMTSTRFGPVVTVCPP